MQPGSSLGGARPKASVIDTDKTLYIAKFPSRKYDYDAGLAAAEELIRRYPDTDGILASNDMAAMAVYKVLHQNGRRVPEDVQLVGFDNIEFSRRMTPELTTISQPIEEMGKLAVQMIIHHGEEISYQKENIFDVELIRRQTTKKKGEAE